MPTQRLGRELRRWPPAPSRRWLAMAGLAIPLLAGLGCRSAAFSFATTQPPRLSVVHRPLNPREAQEITLEARAEAAPGRRVSEIHIDFYRQVPTPATGEPRLATHLETTCRDLDVCTLTVPPGSGAGRALYTATMKDDRSASVNARSGFGFLIGRVAGEIVPLREPVNLLVDDSVFRILLVRDQESYPIDDRGLLADAEGLLYDGLLADPALRWRDHQLAFYLSNYPGRTRGYHSGLQSRCGQAPWLGLAAGGNAEASSAFADVVAVLHLRDGERDCAGLQDLSGARRMSAHGLDPLGFAHELGHALFGLADEYWESTEDRTTRDDDPSDPEPELCFCCDRVLDGRPCGIGEVECASLSERPLECFPAEPACPPIESTCAQPNVFDSRGSCEAAAAEIVAFPGLAGSARTSDCRRLCGGPTRPCPCLPMGSTREVWILDRRRPAVGGGVPDDDLMGDADTASPPERFGPACHRCIETAFCIAWEAGRGRSRTQIEAHCGAAPP